MNDHTALLELPVKLAAAGLNVEVADGWELGQCTGDNHYLFTDPDTLVGSHSQSPSGYMVHHTAGTSATPPPAHSSKAGAWIGLKRGDRLYTTGGGTPTIYLATAGPARISSGFGYKPAAWDYTFKGLRAPAKAEGPQSDPKIALNRFVFNAETVHPGDGTPLDAGVFDHVVGLGIVLHEMFGWTERTLGHLSWAWPRKKDPYWNDDPEAIVVIQDAIAAGLIPDDPTDCIPEWALQYWEPYVDAIWGGGPPDPCKDVNHWQLAVILDKLGLI